jgi:hypothetical protein
MLAASIISFLMIEAASTSETSENFYQTTRHNNPEDSHLHTCHRENLKTQKYWINTNYFRITETNNLLDDMMLNANTIPPAPNVLKG